MSPPLSQLLCLRGQGSGSGRKADRTGALERPGAAPGQGGWKDCSGPWPMKLWHQHLLPTFLPGCPPCSSTHALSASPHALPVLLPGCAALELGCVRSLCALRFHVPTSGSLRRPGQMQKGNGYKGDGKHFSSVNCLALDLLKSTKISKYSKNRSLSFCLLVLQSHIFRVLYNGFLKLPNYIFTQ